MDPSDSIVGWVERLAAGDNAAEQHIWDAFSYRVLELALKQLRSSRSSVADEDDVLVSVFDTLFRRARAGQFSQLKGPEDLWYLLITLTERKIWSLQRKLGAQKRGADILVSESVLRVPGDSVAGGFATLPGLEPTPAFIAEVTENVERMLADLADDELRTIALMRLEGYTNVEIAAQLERPLSTVERRFQLIAPSGDRIS